MEYSQKSQDLAYSWEQTGTPLEAVASDFLELLKLIKEQKEKHMGKYDKDTIMENQEQAGTWTTTTSEPVLTKRDFFAMAALPSLIGITGNSKLFNVKLAYEYADLMIKESKKPVLVPDLEA